MAKKMVWVVRYQDEHDDDRSGDEIYKNKADALKRVEFLVGEITKEERDAVDWDPDQLEVFDEVQDLLKKGDVEGALDVFRDLAGDLNFHETVDLNESYLH